MRIEGRERRAAAVRLGLGSKVSVNGSIHVHYSREDVEAVNAEMKRIREERKSGRESRAMERAKRWAAQYIAEGQDEYTAMRRAMAAALGDGEATDGRPRFGRELRRLMLDEIANARSEGTVFPAQPPRKIYACNHNESQGVSEKEAQERDDADEREDDGGRTARLERPASVREDG